MTVYNDFEFDFGNPLDNKGGSNWTPKKNISKLIYSPKSKNINGHHAIIITGWGIYNNKKYWIIQNSWGLDWGHTGIPQGIGKLPKHMNGGGFFWIKRGNNTCGIETNICVAQADVDNIIYNDKPNKNYPKIAINKLGQFEYELDPLSGGGQWNYPYGSRSQMNPSPLYFKMG